jgi:hypothetical protein
MVLGRFFRWLNYYGQYFPLRINFFFYLILVFSSWFLLNRKIATEDSFSVLIILMAKIAFFFSLLIVFFSLLTVLFSFGMFYLKKKKMQMIYFQMNQSRKTTEANQLEIKLPEARLPMFGTISLNLMLKEKLFSKTIQLNRMIERRFFHLGKGVKCATTILLPDIKEYHFSKAFVHFNDLLSFFKLTTSLEIQYSFQNLPQSSLNNFNEVSPKKADEQLIRIDELRKLEGELINYKKFENSDDVRRIVWKIFAKNKELMVRIPEVMDPFASQTFMYASYFNEFDYELHLNYMQKMLNHYKHTIWSVFDLVAKTQPSITYVSDQTNSGSLTNIAAVQQHITNSDWQHDMPLDIYFKPKHASILCVHSFTSSKQLNAMLEITDTRVQIVFVKLSHLFQVNFFANWISYLFFKPKHDTINTLQSKWALHPLKFKMQQHEKELLALLSKHSNQVCIIS